MCGKTNTSGMLLRLLQTNCAVHFNQTNVNKGSLEIDFSVSHFTHTQIEEALSQLGLLEIQTIRT